MWLQGDRRSIVVFVGARENDLLCKPVLPKATRSRFAAYNSRIGTVVTTWSRFKMSQVSKKTKRRGFAVRSVAPAASECISIHFPSMHHSASKDRLCGHTHPKVAE
jgi:hypothetical protein